MVLAGLRWLASADLASVPVAVQADCLRGLEQVLSVHAAARASALAAFCAQAGYEADAQGSPRTWLTWQTQITRPAATAALSWMRRLDAHPVVAGALRSCAVSMSWARQICEWSDLLPDHARDDADAILLAAAAGGASFADLAVLAEEMRRRLAVPDRDGDGFADRRLRLATTLNGAGRLEADLTPQCAAALQAVLESLGKKAGPLDTRTRCQRDHDALEEACRLLAGSGFLPDRAGQPTKIQLHITLRDLFARLQVRTWPPGPADPFDELGIRSCHGLSDLPGAGPGYDCDASIAPIVTGLVDHDLLDQLAARTDGPPGVPPAFAARRQLILDRAVRLLSGPGTLTSLLRTGTLTGPAASASLPLDVGTVTDTIPPHLRRAVILRDRHCAAPGCDQPPAACQIHHITPRSQGGPTRLTNLLLLCSFHHLILIHRWNWTITLNPDGTRTARSPDGRVLHSHDPPSATTA